MSTFLDMEAGEDRRRPHNDVSDEEDSSGDSDESDSGSESSVGRGGYLSEELPLTQQHRGTKRVLSLPSDSDVDENASQQRSAKKSKSKRPKYASTRILLAARERPLKSSSKGNARLDKGSRRYSEQQRSSPSTSSESPEVEASSGSSERQRSRSAPNTSSESPEIEQRRKETVSVSADVLMKLTQSLKKTERRLKAIEDQLADSDNATRRVGSGKSTPSRKKDVPIEVRRETRRVYNLLMDEDIENFNGWCTEPGVTYLDSQNQAVVNRLLSEVKALNPVYLTQHIKDAAYRFYRSKREEESIKRRGKQDGKAKAKRRHERLLRKLNERKAAFMRGQFKDDEKEKWEGIMKIEYMSSEESGMEDGEDVNIVRPLPWLSASVVQFKTLLDSQSMKEKSPQARRQTKKRKQGCPSKRTRPDVCEPEWAFT